MGISNCIIAGTTVTLNKGLNTELQLFASLIVYFMFTLPDFRPFKFEPLIAATVKSLTVKMGNEYGEVPPEADVFKRSEDPTVSVFVVAVIGIIFGIGFTIMFFDTVLKHPFPSVPLTEKLNVEVGVLEIEFVVSPPPQRNELAPLAVKVVLSPRHNEDFDAAITTFGKAFTVTIPDAPALVQPLLFVMVTLYVPALVVVKVLTFPGAVTPVGTIHV